jgi:2-hydroxychromene-2-carboxylate isomerase
MKIEFFFDFLSPYSYLAWSWLRYNKKLIKGWGYELELRPVVLAKVIKYYETKGPAEIAPKRNYLLRDCMRFCENNNIPFTTPEKLPFNSQGLLRIAESQKGNRFQWEVVDTIFRACWEDGLDMEDDVVVADALYKADLEGELIVQSSSDRSVRQALKDNFTNAIEKKIFGLPSFYVEEEIFWGNDSIPDFVTFLKKEDVLDRKKYNQYLKKHNF